MISRHIECLGQISRYVQITVYKLPKFTGQLLQWHTGRHVCIMRSASVVSCVFKIRDLCVFGNDYKGGTVNKCVSERKRTMCCVVLCCVVLLYQLAVQRLQRSREKGNRRRTQDKVKRSNAQTVMLKPKHCRLNS